MDTRLFSKFILGFGLAVLLFGGYTTRQADTEYLKARAWIVERTKAPVPADRYEPLMLNDIQQAVADGMGYTATMDMWAAKRQERLYIVLAGGVITFLGLAIFFASREKKAIPAAA